jgi:hypothetical protein
MIRPTEIEQDLSAMRDVLERVYPLFTEHNQIGVTARPGVEDPLYDAVGWLPDDAVEGDYSVVNAEFRDSAVEELLRALPFRFGRSRLMRMRPKACLSIHADPSRRYHYAITTNPSCYILDIAKGAGRFHHIPADGRLYQMDAHRMHTAMNAGREERVHLVICSADEEPLDDAVPVGRADRVDLG